MLIFLLALLLIYLTLATLYLVFLACVYFLVPERNHPPAECLNRFIVLVPAHNEEMLIGDLCRSLLGVDYPADKYEVHIIADNCSDRTAAVGRSFPLQVHERLDREHCGKGQAIQWGLAQIDTDQFDAVMIVDADNYVDPGLLAEVNILLNDGEQAIQCFNAVGNREDSWFTELLYVSRLICNLLYHEAKYRIGLSSYLMGNGICFKTGLLKDRGWTAFSAGEDWEYYAQLVGSGIRIGFCARAKVYHQESRSLHQATSQRLRWSSGRFRVTRMLGWHLLVDGIKALKWHVVDASFPLVFPNYSLQINLTILGLLLPLLLESTGAARFFVVAFALLLAGQLLIFVTGAVMSGAPARVMKALFFAPFFLVWKAVIDLLCLSGLYRGDKWVRTRRHKSTG